MRVLVSPDSFKGSLSAADAAEAIAAGWRGVRPEDEVVLLPVADGGEGTAEAVIAARAGEWRPVTVTGPLGDRVQARWGRLPGGEEAIMEMASASGLLLVPESKRNPLVTTTYGTGELLRDALDAGCRRIMIGIGGSATTDGGVGMAQALGWRFFDAQGEKIPTPSTGEVMERITRIDGFGRHAALAETRIDVACDVENPLYGENGAAFVFAPQKGADAEMVRRLDGGLRNLARVIEHDLQHPIANMPGAGAAGGLGAGLAAFCGARLVSGIDMVLDAVRFDDRASGCDLIVTGEGKFDAQTLQGKVVMGIARRAERRGVPVLVLAAVAEEETMRNPGAGIVAVRTFRRLAASDEDSMRRAGHYLAEIAAELAREYGAGS